MCIIYPYKDKKGNSTDAKNFGGGRPLTEYSTIIPLIYICVSINFIENLIQLCQIIILYGVYSKRKRKEFFIQICTKQPTPTLEESKRKRQNLLTDIGGEWYLNNMRYHKFSNKYAKFN